ncbi:MAG: hypothetical protein ACFFD8_01365 [Candidatus Thorarchaeota archaeon]
MSAIYARLKLSSIVLPIIVAIGMITYFVGLIYVLELLGFPLFLPSAVRFFFLPTILAFPWILFVVIFRERTINASETMNRKSNLIPMRWRMLYGFNTLVILAFFIFPFVSPPLAIFAALVLAYRIVHIPENIWEKSQGARLGYTLILFLLLAAVPTYLTIIWFQYFLAPVVGFILWAWIVNFDLMYFTSLCIVNALAVGALLHLSYGTLDTEGNLQYSDNQKVWLIRFAELVIFIVLWILFNPAIPFFGALGFYPNFAFPDPIGFAGTLGNISYINYLCLAIIGIVYIVKYAVGIGGKMRLSILGVLFAAAFLVVEILNSLFGTPGNILRPALIVGSSLLFVFAFLISFFTAPDELMDSDALLVEEIDTSAELEEEEVESSNETEDI